MDRLDDSTPTPAPANHRESDAWISAESFLYDRINYEKMRGSTKRYPFRLEHMRRLVTALGHADALAGHPGSPGRPILFHVGGTKGKGSVSTMIAAILVAAGYKTGLYTSPHLESLRERFQIDLEPCGPDDFVTMVDRLRTATALIEDPDDSGDHRDSARPRDSAPPDDSAPPRDSAPPDDPAPPRASFFELTTAGAYDLFRRRQCDAVVLEVGLGGRLDSTNVFASDVTVITTIGLDHQAVLGNTHAAIAGEKAGILKPGVPLISGVTGSEAWDVIRRRAIQNDAPRYRLGEQIQVKSSPRDGWGSRVRVTCENDVAPEGTPRTVTAEFELEWEGEHQARNAALAVAAASLAPPPTVPREPLVQADADGWGSQGDSGSRPPAPAILKLLGSEGLTDAFAAVHPRGRLERYEIAVSPEVGASKPGPEDEPGAQGDLAPQDSVPRNRGRRTVLLDAAHNEDSIAALLAVVRYRHDGPVTVVFGTSVDKSSGRMLEQISEVAQRVVLTRFTGNPRWVDPQELATQMPADHSATVDVIDDPQEALRSALRDENLEYRDSGCGDSEPRDSRPADSDALEGRDPWVVICGSFFLAAELRPTLRRDQDRGSR